MATQVYAQEKSVFFVMEEAGAVSAGGCTQDWWNTEVAASDEATAMAKLMNVSTGAPILTMDTITYTGATNLLAKAGIHVGVEVGMVLFAYKDGGAGDIVTGEYKITNVAADVLTCSGIDGTDCTVSIRIGGAQGRLQDILDDTDATDHSVTIYVRSTPTLSAKIDADTTGGNPAKNTFKRIVGFNTIPGDMNYGGAYYESPDEILQNGLIDSNKTVVLDANDGGFSILDITVDNIIFENFHFYNSVGQILLVFTGTPKNIIFRNCRFSEAASVYSSGVESVLFDSCYSGDLTGTQYVPTTGQDNIFLNCVLSMAAGVTGIISNVASVGTCVFGCIFVGGGQGVRPLAAGSTMLVMNNTFYNQTDYGVYHNQADNAIVINNIFMLATGAVGIQLNASSCSYNDYNCFIETDGSTLTAMGNFSGELPVIGLHSIEVDPLFTDAANNDFSLKSNSPCRRVGKPTVGAT